MTRAATPPHMCTGPEPARSTAPEPLFRKQTRTSGWDEIGKHIAGKETALWHNSRWPRDMLDE